MIGTQNVRTEEIKFPEKTVRPKIIYLPAQKVIIIWKFVSYKYIMIIASVIFY